MIGLPGGLDAFHEPYGLAITRGSGRLDILIETVLLLESHLVAVALFLIAIRSVDSVSEGSIRGADRADVGGVGELMQRNCWFWRYWNIGELTKVHVPSRSMICKMPLPSASGTLRNDKTLTTVHIIHVSATAACRDDPS